MTCVTCENWKLLVSAMALLMFLSGNINSVYGAPPLSVYADAPTYPLTSDIDATFPAAPTPDVDDQIVLDNTNVVGVGKGTYPDPINDLAILQWISKEAPVKVRVKRRKGVGAVYYVVVAPVGGGQSGGGVSKVLTADIKDFCGNETLYLQDDFMGPWPTTAQWPSVVEWIPDVKTDAANGDPPSPETFFAHAARDTNKGSVSFRLFKPEMGKSYPWSIRKQSDNSVVAGGGGADKLNAANEFKKMNQAGLDVGLYYLLVTKDGDGGWNRRINFVVYQVKIEDVRVTPAKAVDYDEVLGATAGEGISKMPAMPDIRITFLPAIADVSVKMQTKIWYGRENRNDLTSVPADPKTVVSGETWNVMADLGVATIVGGKVLVTVSIDNRVPQSTVEAALFHIRSENPTVEDAKGRLTAEGTPWFAYAIAKREGGTQAGRHYIQFNEIGRVGPAWDDLKYAPNRGGRKVNNDFGWGIMQLTFPPPSKEALWNWKENIDTGLLLIGRKAIQAATWVQTQEAQQQTDDPTKPLANEDFVWNGVTFKKGTAKTPEDACTIKLYGPLQSGGSYAISWKRPTVTPLAPGYWNKNDSQYIEVIMGLLE